MPTLSNGIVYQDLGTRDAAEMAEYQRQERERRRQQQQQNAGGTAAPQPTATTAQTDGQTAQQPAAPQQTSGVVSNVGADPFAAVVRRRAEQDRNLGREDADVAYSQWKDNVGAAFSNGQAAARDKNKGVYSAGYTLWNTIDAINNGEFDLDDENDKKRAQFMVQQAASQFGSVVAENHGWTLVDGDGGQGFSGFDGKNFNFFFKDRNGNTISKSMSPETLRKTLEKQGLVDKADNDPTKKVSTTELDAKYFKNGWSDDTAMTVVEDKTLPAEYRTYVRKRLYESMVSQAIKKEEADWSALMDKKYAASVASADAQNKYNANLAGRAITELIRNEGRQQPAGGENAGGNDANVAPAVNVSDAAAVSTGETKPPEFTPIPEDTRGSFYDSDAYKKALARFNEDWAKSARGADLDEKKSGNEGNLAKAWGAGQGGINGDVETDPEVIELRRREKNGTLTPQSALRLEELTGQTVNKIADQEGLNRARAERDNEQLADRLEADRQERLAKAAESPEPSEVETASQNVSEPEESPVREERQTVDETPVQEQETDTESSSAPWETAKDAGGVYYSDPDKVAAVKRTMDNTDTWAGRIAKQYGLNPDSMSDEDASRLAYMMDQARKTPKGSEERRALRETILDIQKRGEPDATDFVDSSASSDAVSAYEAERFDERADERNRAVSEERNRSRRIETETEAASESTPVRQWTGNNDITEQAGDVLDTAADYWNGARKSQLEQGGEAINRARGLTEGWKDATYTGPNGERHTDTLVQLGNAGRTIANIGRNAANFASAVGHGAASLASGAAEGITGAAGGWRAQARKDEEKQKDAAAAERREQTRMQHIGNRIAQGFDVSDEERKEYSAYKAEKNKTEKTERDRRQARGEDRDGETAFTPNINTVKNNTTLYLADKKHAKQAATYAKWIESKIRQGVPDNQIAREFNLMTQATTGRPLAAFQFLEEYHRQHPKKAK